MTCGVRRRHPVKGGRDSCPAHRADRARRFRGGRVRPSAALATRLWLVRRAGRGRLGPRPHRSRLGGADARSRLHPATSSRAATRRRRHRRNGRPGTRGPARHSPEFPQAGGGQRHRPARGLRGGTRRARRAQHFQDKRLRLLHGSGHPVADDRLRPAGFAGRAVGLDARPRQLLQNLPRPSQLGPRLYPHVIYLSEADKGGHFAAWEEPQLFSEEIRAAFLRPFHAAIAEEAVADLRRRVAAWQAPEREPSRENSAGLSLPATPLMICGTTRAGMTCPPGTSSWRAT